MGGALDSLCNCLVQLLIYLLLIVLSPLLIPEIIMLYVCGIKCLPPLSCMIEKGPFQGSFDRASVPPHKPIPEDLLKKKVDVTECGIVWYQAVGSVAERVETMCQLMLAHNNVATTFDNCPQDLVGVFWMDGNKIPEELACLSYATVDKKDNQFLFNKVNGNCAWTYLDSSVGKFIAWFQEASEASGFMCFAFDSNEYKNGRIWSYSTFEYGEQNLSPNVLLGEFSMERLDTPGVNYYRGCYWFSKVFGRRLEFGSYTLRKIMNADGTKVQPAYDDFVKYQETKNAGLKMITEAVQMAQEGDNVPLTSSA
eukprot:TRINITY_DN62614_c0_g1_i1.p1 TRINITY_DN62614_c0_g1~~TRINITY_DN62614_c0_g1_i1.p1  ORF type:complete len:310 (+),score=61.31 TRINITY_DN62614_c0_g1_i1:81-1010(+)